MVAPVIQVDDALHRGAFRFEVEQEAMNEVLDESPGQQPGRYQSAEPGNRHAPAAQAERPAASGRKMAAGTAS